MNHFFHIMKFKGFWTVIYIGFLTAPAALNAQQEKPNNNDYDFQVSEMTIPKNAPNGYESILTVELNKSLNADTAYEVGFWIFGPQLKNQAYSYPIALFPSNFRGSINRNILDIVESIDIMPKLEVRPPPSYTSKGHFTFIVRPEEEYNQLTVALKNRNRGKSPIDFSKDVTVTGVFVRPLPDRNQKQKIEEKTKEIISNQAEPTPELLTDRILMDSKKSYTISEKSLQIGLYDHRNIDKDVVTIYLNDSIVVESLQLERKKKFFDIELRPGKNTITLHAENLGNVGPNTAAILIKSKKQEFMAVLVSDLGQSQFFTLVYEEESKY